MCLSCHIANTSRDEMVNLGGEILGQKNIQQSTKCVDLAVSQSKQ